MREFLIDLKEILLKSGTLLCLAISGWMGMVMLALVLIFATAACTPAPPPPPTERQLIMFAECMNKGLDYYKNVEHFPHTIDVTQASYPNNYLVSTVVKTACTDNAFSFGQLSVNPDVIIVPQETPVG